MTHFLNVDIKEKKNLEIALSGIYGIGRKEAIKVCKHLGLNSKKKFKELNNKILTCSASKSLLEGNVVAKSFLYRFGTKYVLALSEFVSQIQKF